MNGFHSLQGLGSTALGRVFLFLHQLNNVSLFLPCQHFGGGVLIRDLLSRAENFTLSVVMPCDLELSRRYILLQLLAHLHLHSEHLVLSHPLPDKVSEALHELVVLYRLGRLAYNCELEVAPSVARIDELFKLR